MGSPIPRSRAAVDAVRATRRVYAVFTQPRLILSCSVFFAGVRFVDGIDLGAFGDDGMQPRGTWRLSCSVLTDLRANGADVLRVRLCDVSERGFMGECDRNVPIGSTVSLDLPGYGAVHARVRWSMGGRIGGRFMDAVDFDACRRGIEVATNTV